VSELLQGIGKKFNVIAKGAEDAELKQLLAIVLSWLWSMRTAGSFKPIHFLPNPQLSGFY